MKVKVAILCMAIFSIITFSSNAFAFYKGWWMSEDKKGIINITDEFITIQNDRGKIIHIIDDGDKVYLFCISEKKFNKLKDGELEKIISQIPKDINAAKPRATVTVKKFSDSKVGIKTFFFSERPFHKITEEEAHKLLSPNK